MSATKEAQQKRRDWTTKEIALLEAIAPHGRVAVALAVGRSISSVVTQAARRGISLRRAGETRGRRILSDRPTIRLGALELCPRCAVDPIEVEETGLCRTCHLKHLAAQHEREIAAKEAREAEAQRELDAARQRKHRAKVDV